MRIGREIDPVGMPPPRRSGFEHRARPETDQLRFSPAPRRRVEIGKPLDPDDLRRRRQHLRGIDSKPSAEIPEHQLVIAIIRSRREQAGGIRRLISALVFAVDEVIAAEDLRDVKLGVV